MKHQQNLRQRIAGFSHENVTGLDEDFFLAALTNHDRPAFSDLTYTDHPVRMETASVTLMLRGEADFNLDVRSYRMPAPCLTVFFPDQILQHIRRSEEFDARYIHFSPSFFEEVSHSFHDHTQFVHRMKASPVIPLTSSEASNLEASFQKARGIVNTCDNPHRRKMIVHWAILLFYDILSCIRQQPADAYQSSRAQLVTRFLDLVRDHHALRRELSFYADHLCLTPKYLTTLIKQETGTTAGDWIERYTILHAQALLKSTDLTILQISDRLHFSSQVFFGKYFKRVTGIAPSEYRKGQLGNDKG